jgi:hypothetical protein
MKEGRYPEANYEDDGRNHGWLIMIENKSCFGFRHFVTVRPQDPLVKEGEKRIKSVKD